MPNNKEIIITGVHLTLTDAIKNIVHEKTQKLLNHAERALRIRVELIKEVKKNAKEEFTAKGIININGPDLVASETTDDLYKSVDKMVHMLDRMLSERARTKISKIKHPHNVEIPSHIPKVSP